MTSQPTFLTFDIKFYQASLHTALQREIELTNDLSRAKVLISSAGGVVEESVKTKNIFVGDEDDDTSEFLDTHAGPLEALSSSSSSSSSSSTMNFRSAKDWQRRCIHLDRLILAYEERIKFLEVINFQFLILCLYA